MYSRMNYNDNLFTEEYLEKLPEPFEDINRYERVNALTNFLDSMYIQMAANKNKHSDHKYPFYLELEVIIELTIICFGDVIPGVSGRKTTRFTITMEKPWVESIELMVKEVMKKVAMLPHIQESTENYNCKKLEQKLRDDFTIRVYKGFAREALYILRKEKQRILLLKKEWFKWHITMALFHQIDSWVGHIDAANLRTLKVTELQTCIRQYEFILSEFAKLNPLKTF